MKIVLALLLATSSLGAEPIKIALIGDSTVNDEGGWGTGFRACFSSQVTVVNLAKNGRSSKSFRDEGWWTKTLAEKPRYVLIQFGHNDGPGKGPERETDPATTFRGNLTRYIDESREAGAIPVLVTSIVRRNFETNGKLRRDSLVPYVAEVKRLAAEKKVPLLDLYTLTLEQAESLGSNRADTLGATGPDGKPDRTHLGPRGRMLIGVMAAKEMIRAVPELAPQYHELVDWRNALQQPPSWYGGPEASRIADNLLVYQHGNAAWDKNIDMAMPLNDGDRKKIAQQKAVGHTTIDNGATHTQLRYLARVHSATQKPEYAAAFLKGLHYLLDAQYPNGGWPQFYPIRKGYYTHITYNDDAMIGVMELLRAVAKQHAEYRFVSVEDRRRSEEAVQKGIAIILKTQVIRDGKRTAWCAQHDENTLAPVKARSYELPSLSGSESVQVVRFLMGIDNPSAEIVAAIEGAVAWFRASAIAGIRIERTNAPGTPRGTDLVVVEDPKAPPQWARFYDLETNLPFFCGRDGVKKMQMSEIEYERRNGYRWYVDSPAKLLNDDYPKWKRRP